VLLELEVEIELLLTVVDVVGIADEAGAEEGISETPINTRNGNVKHTYDINPAQLRG
jgi:hypothetical protein